MSPDREASPDAAVEAVARAFHNTYERLAPHYDYETRKSSAVPWENVPANNRALMVAVVADLLAAGAVYLPSDWEKVSPLPNIYESCPDCRRHDRSCIHVPPAGSPRWGVPSYRFVGPGTPP